MINFTNTQKCQTQNENEEKMTIYSTATVGVAGGIIKDITNNMSLDQ